MNDFPSSKALLHCPFCGDDDVELSNNGVLAFWASCQACDADGPVKQNTDDAIEDWNRVARLAHEPSACQNCESLRERLYQSLVIRGYAQHEAHAEVWGAAETKNADPPAPARVIPQQDTQPRMRAEVEIPAAGGSADETRASPVCSNCGKAPRASNVDMYCVECGPKIRKIVGDPGLGLSRGPESEDVSQ